MGDTPQTVDRLTPVNTAPKRDLYEPLALALLSQATVGTAWCSFQAAVWGGVSQRAMNLAAFIFAAARLLLLPVQL